MHSFEEAHIGDGSDKAISKYSRFQIQVMVSIFNHHPNSGLDTGSTFVSND
jgi:hypothetical protein